MKYSCTSHTCVNFFFFFSFKDSLSIYLYINVRNLYIYIFHVHLYIYKKNNYIRIELLEYKMLCLYIYINFCIL